MAEPIVFQKLQAWQDENSVDDKALALAIKVNRTTIWRAKRGLRVLGMDLQLKLQKITKIPPAEWAEFYAQTVHLRGAKAPGSKKKGLGVETVRGAA